MSDKTELLEALEKTLDVLAIKYHHAVVSEENGRYKLSVRCGHKEAKLIGKMFLSMTNFCCESTSSYKRNACQEVKTFFKYSMDIPKAIDFLKVFHL